MTKISKTSSVDTFNKTARVNPNTVFKSSHKSVKKDTRANLVELKEKIILLINDKAITQEETKRKIITEIVEWQFGDSLTSDKKVKFAYNKLIENAKDSTVYQNLLDSVLNS